MKRCLRFAVVCAVVLIMASVAVAQQKPEHVIRLGDWVEIGNEAFMNIIATGDMRFTSTHNFDFEDSIRDRAASRDPASTTLHNQEGDIFYVEGRWGADFRYQKSLRFQILFEWQATLDGNLIDDRTNSANPGGTDIFGRAAGNEGESMNLERIWLQYKFYGTPLRIHVGPDLWYSDPAGVIGDDDPRFGFYLDLNNLEIGAWAVLQTESHRLGLENDHDFWYYVFHLAYNLKPFVFGLDVAYFRDRATGAPGCAAAACAGGTLSTTTGQEHDSVIVMPSWSGNFGVVTALLQPMLVFGSAESATARPGGQRDYDIFAWGGAAYLEANLGVIRPFLGLFIGSADDDEDDSDLTGFAPLPQREITLVTGTRFFGALDVSTSIGSRDVVTPARNGSAQFGGQEFSHTVGNPWNDRLANTAHVGINTTYGNPGTLRIPAGVIITPIKSHEFVLAYIYNAMLDSSILESVLGVSVDEELYHEIMGLWEWTINRHFDIRLSGSVLLPGDGVKDIARASTTTATGSAVSGVNSGCGLNSTCQGEDIAFKGEARFRARF